jgi:lipoate-protein ligase A
VKLLDLTLPSPAENLAADEALLDAAEAGQSDEVLRFWESPVPFVVLGYSNRASTEVDVKECDAAGLPVLRRCTGGGTVVQGPGCLNYALILKIETDNAFQSISLANQFIMARNRAAIQTLLNRPVRIQGYTDLTLGDLKFSGNSQRRHRRFLLFHGTFLLHADLGLIDKVLPMPSHQPNYRGGRVHSNFLTTLGVSSTDVKAAVARDWMAIESLETVPQDRIEELARKRYATREWSFKF